ncbi:hypothetical protein ACFE04_029552 [Oxalis oulophora]
MNCVSVPLSLLVPSRSRLTLPFRKLQPPVSLTFSSRSSLYPLSNHKSSISVATPSDEGAVSTIRIEDFYEKDWSFLDSDEFNSKEQANRIISYGEIQSSSKVLVSVGSEQFVDQLVESSPCDLLLVVHESLLTLACVKEKYDDVKCWHGELVNMPEKWGAFDVVFLYFLPALSCKLEQILEMLAKRCSPGARLVISHPQGKEVLEQQRKEFPDVIVSGLPDETTLQKTAADYSFEMAEFVNEPGFYLAVLKYGKE